MKGVENMINDAGCMRQIGIKETKDLDGNIQYSGIYGMEVILDCYGCNRKLFYKKHLKRYFKGLVEEIDMQAADRYFFRESTGLCAIQFIETSNITVHCHNKLKRLYVNIFSCKEFDAYDAKIYTDDFFSPRRIDERTVLRI